MRVCRAMLTCDKDRTHIYIHRHTRRSTHTESAAHTLSRAEASGRFPQGLDRFANDLINHKYMGRRTNARAACVGVTVCGLSCACVSSCNLVKGSAAGTRSRALQSHMYTCAHARTHSLAARAVNNPDSMNVGVQPGDNVGERHPAIHVWALSLGPA